MTAALRRLRGASRFVGAGLLVREHVVGALAQDVEKEDAPLQEVSLVAPGLLPRRRCGSWAVRTFTVRRGRAYVGEIVDFHRNAF